MITLLTATAHMVQAEPAALSRARLRSRRRALWLRHLWATGTLEADRGLAITHSEVDRILTPPADLAGAETEFYKRDEEAAGLAGPIAEADQRWRHDPAWQRLRRAFALTDAEGDLLALALAAELDPGLCRVYGYLSDDSNASHATPWLAAALYGWPEAARFGPESGLVRWRLALPAASWADPWSITTPWLADPFSVAWLGRGEQRDPALGDRARFADVEDAARQACLYPAQLAGLLGFVRALDRGDEARPGDGSVTEIELLGLPGSGKRTLAAQACAALGCEMLVVDTPTLAAAGASHAAEGAERAVRLARLAGAALYWDGAGEIDAPIVGPAGAGLVFYGAQEPLAQLEPARAARKAVRLPPLTRSQRTSLWQSLSAAPVPGPVAGWQLTPAEIAAAAQAAPAGPHAVAEVCRRMLRRSPGELFSPLPCPYDWDDIVLAAPVREHLEEVAQQARLRWTVYEDWGFGRLVPLGKGISALFTGPSGTGKTMAAQVLARTLDMELYRVDLAGVMNKYIGETEKRLKQVFDACERANVLLFFDEADALFGQRTQVKDAHDRFANIEIDYLLQRMEQFDGIAILATNRKNDLDQAFLRRIRFVVDFLPPGPAERLALWQKALQPRAPDGSELLGEIDWQRLASRLTMTGADIKAAALSAAFLARGQGSRVTMSHILHAASREMAKHGVLLRPEEWVGVR